MEMNQWKSQSSPGKQVLLALLCLGVGLVLVVKFLDAPGQTVSNARAIMGLGALLLTIGVVGIATTGIETVIIDPKMRRITIDDVRLIGTKRRAISFSDIVNIRIGYLGKASNFVQFYYLVLQLKGGEEYSLFSPGRGYDGAMDQSVVEGWRRRLQGYLQN
ncbi:MAG: hypothetical protein KKD63_01525 [Proteobacteria bacterium]|nr:hypothetical protein [Desulfobulbaceae bacterium]MBU4151542.1 hypothetical protein [Pseudomonadota bacterium]